MRNIIFGGIILAIIGALVVAFVGNNNSTTTSRFQAIQDEVAQGAYLYDVRTPEEYTAGHFASSVLFPLQDIESGKLPSVAKDTKIYVYCRSGNRSSQAVVLLQKAGYTNVSDLGGLSSVEAGGGKLVLE